MSDVTTNGHGEVIDTGRLLVTSKGVALQLVGVSPLLIAKLQSAGELPPVPTRKLALDFGIDGEEGEGNYQLEELDGKDFLDEEEEKAWKEYVEKRDAVLAKRNDNFLKAVFAKGVVVDLSRIDLWKEEQAFFDLPVPEHPLALKVEYIQTEALGNTQDMVDVITGVLGESGVPEEDLAEVRAMFQRSVRRPTAGETIDPEIEVDMASDVHGDEDSEGMGGVASQRLLQGE